MTDPKLIMLDEPMAGVNPALKQSLLDHIRGLKDEGRTVLFVEHDMDMVQEISDWVIVLAEGRLIAEGTARAISGNREVIDAYLGAHHDVDIGALDEAEAIEELGLDAEELGLDQLAHLGEIDHSEAHSNERGSWRSPATQAVIAFPGHAGRCRPLVRWRSLARIGGRRARSLAADAGSPMTAVEAPPTVNVIEAREVVAGYVPEVNILNGCDLTVAPGEFVGIIGPNGAGKSTLLKAVLGMVTVHSGAILLNGDDITGHPAHKLVQRGVGYVPQTRNVFQALTVKENLEMGCFLAPKRFDERYEVVTGLFPRLAQRSSQRAGSLSGGERQMVAMGRALMLDPMLLLLDEPSAGLSPMLQDEVFMRCKLINDHGVAILMVEQNARRCLQVCHRGYVLDQGRNAYTGTGRRAVDRSQGDRALPRHDGPQRPEGVAPCAGPVSGRRLG